MKWVALIEYAQQPELVTTHRPAHRAYLRGLLDAGQLVCSGPLTDHYGALIVYEAADQAEAETLIHNDPFFLNGVFVRWELHPWNPVMVNPQLITNELI